MLFSDLNQGIQEKKFITLWCTIQVETVIVDLDHVYIDDFDHVDQQMFLIDRCFVSSQEVVRLPKHISYSMMYVTRKVVLFEILLYFSGNIICL